jgi:hypothetical protein
MGESKKDALRVNFDRKLKLEFHASVSHQRRGFVGIQRGLSYKSARKSPRKREILAVQIEFGKMIGIEKTELCFVNV